MITTNRIITNRFKLEFSSEQANRQKECRFRRLDSRIQTSEFCLWKIFIFQIQTSESLISDVWICCLGFVCLFCLVFPNLVDACWFPFVIITYNRLWWHFLRDFWEYPFRWIQYRFHWILFTFSNVNLSDWLFLQSSLWFVTLKI